MRSSRFGMVSKCVFALLTQWAKKGKKYPFYVVKIPVSKVYLVKLPFYLLKKYPNLFSKTPLFL